MFNTDQDAFALGGRQDDDDKVRALLAQWIELYRAADRAIDDDAEWQRLLDEKDAIADQIAIAKPSAIGLAAKAYLLLRHELYNFDLAHEGAAIAPDPLGENEGFAAAILRDVVTFLPELAPLAEPVLAAVRNAVPRVTVGPG